MKDFDRIYMEFQKPILGYVQKKIRDTETARDLTQEIFIKVFRFHHTFDRGKRFSTWLWSIARNAVTDHLRSDRGHLTEELLEDIPCEAESIESRLIARDHRKNVLKTLKAMTRMQKRILWLRTVHRLSFAEIAIRLGLTLGAAKSLASRAKQALPGPRRTT